MCSRSKPWVEHKHCYTEYLAHFGATRGHGEESVALGQLTEAGTAASLLITDSSFRIRTWGLAEKEEDAVLEES